MKRKSIIFFGLIVLFILSLSLTILAKEQVYDFRKTNWGMNIEQVKATEKGEANFENEKLLSYKTKLNGNDFVYVYMFLENKLYSSAYLNRSTHTNMNAYIDDYKNFKEILTKKYGEPKEDEIYWENDLFKSSVQDWGLAVSAGHLVYRVKWETITTKIGLLLRGDNYEISLCILYESKELEEWVKQIKEKETSKDF